MSFFENRIKEQVVNALRRWGFHVAIDRIRWREIAGVELHDVILTRQSATGQSVRIEKIIARLFLWRSFIHFSPECELKAEKVSIDLRIVSDAPLCFTTFETAFRFGKKRQLAQVDADGLSFLLQHDRCKTHDDFYLQIPSAPWDDIVGPLRPYLLCPWVKEACSANRLSLVACYRRGKSPQVPDYFDAKIEAKDFSLSYPAGEEYPQIDRAFLVKALNDKLGASFVPYDDLPESLVGAFVCTEDPQFWDHKGISPYFIGYAIRENLQRKKISRGASTITMQVARNLFLNHNRTLLRKAEEGIIALLLENYHKVGKQTIMELYANLIEFAPGIYGVQAASRFYFDKDVCELLLTEVLTLTYIIPRPRHFYEALLDRTEQLRRNLRRHIRSYASVMFRKRIIGEREYKDIDYTLRFAPRFGTLDLLIP